MAPASGEPKLDRKSAADFSKRLLGRIRAACPSITARESEQMYVTSEAFSF